MRYRRGFPQTRFPVESQANSRLIPPETFISDLTELWSPRYPNWAYQDSARTTPATANGDRVGSVTGHINGIHLSQATAGARSTISTSGLKGYSCLTFDGTDDYLRSAVSIALKSTDGGYMIGLVIKTMNYVNGRVLSITDSETVGNDYDMQNGTNIVAYVPDIVRSEHLHPASHPSLSPVPSTDTYILLDFDDTAGSRTLYGGGLSDTDAFPSGGGFAPDRVFLNVGILGGGITGYGATTIQEAFVLNRKPTAGEVAGVLSWMQSYWGVA